MRELAHLYQPSGEVRYIDPYSQAQLSGRIGRDPKIKSLPTSTPEATYEKTFVDPKCVACGQRDVGPHSAKVCQRCEAQLKDRFGKDVDKLPDPAIMRMRWAHWDETAAKQAGKTEEDIKLERIKNRRELRDEKRKVRRIEKKAPVLEDVFSDLYSVEHGELKRPIEDPEIRSVVDAMERERQEKRERPGNRRKRSPTSTPSRTHMMERAGAPFVSAREVQIDRDMRDATKRLRRLETQLANTPAEDTHERGKVQRRLVRAQKHIAEVEARRAALQEQASGKIRDYVTDNRRAMVQRYWPRMAPDERADVAREMLAGEVDPFVTHTLAAYAARDLNRNRKLREGQRLNVPPVDFRSRR